MDLQAWKEAARKKLEALAAEGRAGMPAMLYGGLSAATIFPLVEATSQAAGQSDVAALMALGGLASSVGGKLVAEQISRWRDKSEQEIGAELDASAESDPEWRAALDALLTEFEAPRVVQAILSEADRDWFVGALRAGFFSGALGHEVGGEGDPRGRNESSCRRPRARTVCSCSE